MPVLERGKAARRDNSCKSSAPATQPWTTSRCHRLIRPLKSKLQALKSLLESPSVATVVIPPKQTKRMPQESSYVPRKKQFGANRSLRRTTSDRTLFYGEIRPNRFRSTYSSNSSRGPAPQIVIPAPPPNLAAVTTSVYDLPFPAPALEWGNSVNATAFVPGAARVQTQVSKESDPYHPQALLQSLKPNLHPSVFHMYTGIYSALETILTSTTWIPEPCEPVPLKILAARKIGQCILATEGEVDADDVWYDTANEVGVGGEYLREIVRWHAVELAREAICSNIMPSQLKSGVGLPGILVGLCRHLHADAEAESLLKTMIELYPLSENSNNPSLVALMYFWKDSKGSRSRILADSFVLEGSPIPLGNSTINNLLKSAIGDIEKCESSRNLVAKALESGFGIWGDSHIIAAANCRKDLARRKGSRRLGRIEVGVRDRKPRNCKYVSTRVGEKAEDMAFFLTEKLVAALSNPQNTQALGVTSSLACGFILQGEAMRDATENEWSDRFPIAAKVTILLQGLGRQDTKHDTSIVEEIARCLEEVYTSSGKDGLRSLGEFVAMCYENLYTNNGNSITDGDEVKILVNRLVSYASTGIITTFKGDAIPSTPIKTPITPHKPTFHLVTFTPGKEPADSQQEKERYYITQLALSISIGFSALDRIKCNNKWNRWVRKVEHQIIGMKIRTPAKPMAMREDISKTPENGTKKRKGWRWEEGLDEWVEVGGTPGGALKEKSKIPRPAIFKRVEIAVDVFKKQNWRKDYITFENHLDSEGLGEDSEYSDKDSDGDKEPGDSDEELPTFAPLSPTSSTQSFNTDLSSEDLDTSFSRLFDSNPESSASEFDSEKSEEEREEEYYAPTYAHPPASVRRSPRKTQRIKRSLHAFSVILPSSSPLLISTRRQPGRKSFNLTGPIRSSSPTTDNERAGEIPLQNHHRLAEIRCDLLPPSSVCSEHEEDQDDEPSPPARKHRSFATQRAPTLSPSPSPQSDGDRGYKAPRARQRRSQHNTSSSSEGGCHHILASLSGNMSTEEARNKRKRRSLLLMPQKRPRPPPPSRQQSKRQVTLGSDAYSEDELAMRPL